MFLVFGKCPFLLCWKNVLSVSHPLHLSFSRNKSVTRIRYSTIYYPVHKVHFSRYTSRIHAVIAWVLCPTYRLREPQAAEEINFVAG